MHKSWLSAWFSSCGLAQQCVAVVVLMAAMVPALMWLLTRGPFTLMSVFWPQPALDQVQAENRERLLLGTGKPCVPVHKSSCMLLLLPLDMWRMC